jgi:tetratricopeptide (TPR) repeat protein
MSPSAEFPLRQDVSVELARLGREFLAELMRRETQRHPRNLAALADLGALLTDLGRHAEGLEVDREIVRLSPQDPTAHYNLGCSLALLARKDEALDALERAVELGYDDGAFLASDEDLACLRAEQRFVALVRRLDEKLSSL